MALIAINSTKSVTLTHTIELLTHTHTILNMYTVFFK